VIEERAASVKVSNSQSEPYEVESTEVEERAAVHERTDTAERAEKMKEATMI
jgi:hypothetical protein